MFSDTKLVPSVVSERFLCILFFLKMSTATYVFHFLLLAKSKQLDYIEFYHLLLSFIHVLNDTMFVLIYCD